VLPEADMRLLEGLPYPRPDRAEIIAANIATARAFFPRARALAERIGVPWPPRSRTRPGATSSGPSVRKRM
jgi:hypothetical protein